MPGNQTYRARVSEKSRYSSDASTLRPRDCTKSMRRVGGISHRNYGFTRGSQMRVARSARKMQLYRVCPPPPPARMEHRRGCEQPRRCSVPSVCSRARRIARKSRKGCTHRVCMHEHAHTGSICKYTYICVRKPVYACIHAIFPFSLSPLSHARAHIHT